MRLTNLLPLLLLLAAAGPLRSQPAQDRSEPEFTVRNLGAINSLQDEYSPYVTPNGGWLYFTSSRDGRSGIYRSSRNGGDWNPPEYPPHGGMNTMQDDGAFSAPIPLLAEIFSLDADAMRRLNFPGFGILTSANRQGGAGDADLYMIGIAPDMVQLDSVTPLGMVNTEDWEAQGAVASDGSAIIFSSERSDGVGDMDLYISVRNPDGGYSDPVNLGETINTSDNEFSPFLSPDGTTLFFASTGHEGFGGSDLYMSERMEDGSWGPPVNLGEKVNTSANELFFFGVGRERCFFVSDRQGGKGGLDIYEARPNIFATRHALVKIAIVDTSTGKAVPGRARVVEQTLERGVTEAAITEQGAELSLFPISSYRLEITPVGFPAISRELGALKPNSERSITLNVGSAAVARAQLSQMSQPEFSLASEDLDLPWFISGYYRINTPELLEDLRQRQESGDLKRQTYIANIAGNRELLEDYRTQSEQVRSIIDQFYRYAVEEYFPAYLKGKNEPEYLEITVHGFADPRPVTGTYNEKPVTFYDVAGNEVKVESGEKLTNFKLAGLRAYYTVEFFDRLFRGAAAQGHPEYATLVDRGLIRWRPVSGDVDTSGGADMSQLRRAKIDFRRVDPTKPDLR